MFAFITLGTNDLSLSSKFYDKLLESLGIFKVINQERYIGYAKKDNFDLIQQGQSELIEFYLMSPFDKKKATNGNGTMIVFNEKTKEKVNEFHHIALSNGATNEGLPGPRHDEHYYAYIRDPEGNKICAFALTS
jgi:predicted lactoylglutathione lyase